MNISWLNRLWRWVRWPLAGLLVLFIVFFMWSVYLGRNAVLTARAVAKIHANHLTPADISDALPAQPDPVANNATLAGVDANNNGIRDDVEISIYNAHKNSWRVAIAELQYAKELQMEFTQVFNSDTLVAVLQENSRGFGCIYNTVQAKDLNTLNKLAEPRVKEVENLVFNTDVRKQAEEDILKKYMRGYALPNGTDCDIDPTTLPN